MRTLLSVAASAAALVLLAGCTTASQDGGTTPDAAAASPSPTASGFDMSTVQVDDKLAAAVPAEVSEDGMLTIGSELTYAPVEFVAVDGKTPVGIDIDIAGAVAAKLGLAPDVQSSTFDAIIPAVGTRYEVGFSAFTVTPERLDTVNMVSYFSAGSQFAVAAGNPNDVDPSNLCGLTVGVQTGTVQHDEVEAASATCEDEGQDAVEVLPYDSQADVATNLVGGKVQAMYADSPVTSYAVQQSGGAIEPIGDVTDAAPYGVVVAKEDAEFAAVIRSALQRLIDDGTLDRIAETWGSEGSVLTTAEVNPAAR
ncbi:ABC transporter substrate-binding protein [Isoptericola sp. NEAU-Y5]|uniref:ABC transporter substrate-binding protein n=1 Tax=Isoptericola luteus TaxID=2879484 RepID=A0ABS7Z9Q4_9MICO|nr:ABC transporter substrate-binding protein [Isoptericola sp. NEAU-Y5]MCA5891781.1 ABC transporter substrate-binding protein [Isoptericola sp. NEAU-Y5]